MKNVAVLSFHSILLVLMSLGIVGSALAQPVQEVRIQWQSYPAGAPEKLEPSFSKPLTNSFTVVHQRVVSGRLPRQRNPELSTDQIVVIARDADGRDLDSHLIPDPRILRAEQPDSSGKLTGQILYRANADFFITLPADPKIKQIDFYHPQWSGTEFSLESLGTVVVK